MQKKGKAAKGKRAGASWEQWKGKAPKAKPAPEGYEKRLVGAVGPNPGKGGGVGPGVHPEADWQSPSENGLGKGPRREDVGPTGQGQGQAFAELPHFSE